MISRLLLAVCLVAVSFRAIAGIEAGVAERDVTPRNPISMAGYAARKHPSEKIDAALKLGALALRSAEQKFVFVSLDNCEFSREFMAPVLADAEKKYGLQKGCVMIVASHTHGGPALEKTLESLYNFSPAELEEVQKYSQFLREQIIEVVGAAIDDLKPAVLSHGTGRATFAINRRVFKEKGVVIGENPDGPVDWDVPVLRVSGANGAVRAVLFGYTCHGTSIGEDNFYTISPDYMGYAREEIEKLYPGAIAMYVAGAGGDSNPFPRGTLLDAKRHGVELAGGIIGAMNRPMQPANGALNVAFADVDLPLADPPTRDQIEKEAKNKDRYIRYRAEVSLKRLDEGKSLPSSVKLSLAAIRIGNDLTFVAMGGEPVIDYGIKFKRLFSADHPWVIGYAYDSPGYIPSMRVIKEGGYEAESSLVYVACYGPFRESTETVIVNKMTALVESVRSP